MTQSNILGEIGEIEIIKTPNGTQWLTIPVKVKEKYFQSIFDTTINDKNWASNHLKAIS